MENVCMPRSTKDPSIGDFVTITESSVIFSIDGVTRTVQTRLSRPKGPNKRLSWSPLSMLLPQRKAQQSLKLQPLTQAKLPSTPLPLA
ncbi:hypothetical protein V6N13_025802 [Hibiscus sabdariffa]